MPKVTIWIREGEDFAVWKRITDKPEFIHTAIRVAAMYKDPKLPYIVTNKETWGSASNISKEIIDSASKVPSKCETCGKYWCEHKEDKK